MQIAITLIGEKGEFQSSIVVDGEKGSILFQDSNLIIGRQGRAIVNISNNSNQDLGNAKCACNNIKLSECR